MPPLLTPDICVIGAGSGGLSVAAAAAAFGVEVVLVERGAMGGDCLNTGCVPSKALIAAARHAEAIREAAAFGVEAGPVRIDFARVRAHVRDVIDGIAPHDSQERFEGLGVKVIRAEARFTGPEAVSAGGFEIRARRFVVATGSGPVLPPIPGLADVPVLTNESVFDLTALPERLLVLGGGPIGLELAQAFRRLGSEVTVLEAERALGREDPDLARVALERIRRDGVSLREGAKVERVERGPEGIVLSVAGPDGTERIAGSHLLVAAGRAPTTAGLDLERAGIAQDRRGITVDRGLRTTNRRVYAIGDVASVEGRGGLQFTHVAGYHAGLVVRSILFRLPVRENRDLLPRVTYTDPEVGQVGLTEAEARARHGDGIRVLTVPMAASDRARAERETDGLVKLVVTGKGRLLGAGAAGRNAGELVNLWSLALAAGLTVRPVAGFVSPYPTVGELARRAAIEFYRPTLASPWLRRVIRVLRIFG
ncbi:dihydrolipoyl dehydrogenase family protein [Prosthecomicrobium sp. N25]|uniref:dihydrolipoyl dehydrogenase family protein n=1 Tax=Prosthecomicrobium sp. N25 TaxID=3129254 RepID=UPI0030787400